MLYLLRNYTELAYLALRKEKSIENFMFRFELSKYEFKRDFNILKEMESAYGLKIEIVNDYITASVIDKETYEKKYRGLFSFYYNNRYIFNDNDLIIKYYLINKLLYDRCLVVEDYANELGYSKSAIRTPLKKARKYIEENGIRTINKPYYGLCIEGNELDIRRCLCAIYNMIMPEILIDNGEIQNEIQTVDYSKHYNNFINYCFEKSYNFETEDNKKICYYLAVTEARLNKGEVIIDLNIERDLFNELKEDKELRSFALDIFNLNNFPIIETELQAFMLNLLTCRLHHDKVGRIVENYYGKEQEALYFEIMKMLRTRFQLNIKDEHILGIINKIISIYVVKYHSNELDKQKYRLTGMSSNIYSFALCYFINESIKEVINKFYNIDVHSAVAEKITDAVFFYIDSLGYNFQKSKIALSIRGAAFGAELLKRKIEKDIDPRYIDSVDIIPNLELLNRDDYYKKKYDLIITDINLKNLSKTITISDLNNSTILLERYLRMSRNICENINSGSFNIYSNKVEIENSNNLEECISKATGLAFNEVGHCLRHYYLWKDTIFTILRSNCEDTTIYIGDFSVPIMKENRKMNSYFIYKGDISEKNIYVVNSLIHEFSHDKLFFLELKNKPDVSTINDHLNQIIK